MSEELNNYLKRCFDLTPTERLTLVDFFSETINLNNLISVICDEDSVIDDVLSLLADQIMIYKDRLEKEAKP